MREVLGFRPWTRQDAIDTGREPGTSQEEWGEALVRDRRVSVVANNGSGKTHYCAGLCIWFMLTRANATVVTTAPTGAQVKKFLWKYLRGLHSSSRTKLPGPKPLTQTWQLSPTWTCEGFSTDREEQAQGFHTYTDLTRGDRGVEGELLAVLDEAGGLQPYVYNALHGWTTKGECYIIQIGNANVAEGDFFLSQQPDSLWTSFQCSAFNCPTFMVSDQWIEDRKKDPGEGTPLYNIRVLGQFSDQGGEYQFFPPFLLQNVLHANPYTDGKFEGEPEKHMGVDIADEGKDRCVASLLDGMRLSAVEAWNTVEPMDSAERIIALAGMWGIRQEHAHHIHIDRIGVGSGVCSRLREKGWMIDPVDYGAGCEGDYPALVSEETKLGNRKAELHWIGRQLCIEGMVGIPSEFHITRRQLGWLRWRLQTGTETMLCESKEKLKKKTGGESPDYADSFLLALSRAGRFVGIEVDYD